MALFQKNSDKRKVQRREQASDLLQSHAGTAALLIPVKYGHYTLVVFRIGQISYHPMRLEISFA